MPETSEVRDLTRVVLLKRRRYRAAEEQLLRAVELDPANVDAVNNLGLAIARQRGRRREAIDVFDRAARLDPQGPAGKNLHDSSKHWVGYAGLVASWVIFRMIRTAWMSGDWQGLWNRGSSPPGPRSRSAWRGFRSAGAEQTCRPRPETSSMTSPAAPAPPGGATPCSTAFCSPASWWDVVGDRDLPGAAGQHGAACADVLRLSGRRRHGGRAFPPPHRIVRVGAGPVNRAFDAALTGGMLVY